MKIVVSGTSASGKSTVAKQLARQLGYPHFSMGDLQRELAKEHGVDIVTWGRMEAEDDRYDRMVDERQARIARENKDFVIDSWLGAHFIPDAVKVFIDADLEERARRRLGHRRSEEAYDDIETVKKEMQRRHRLNRERWIRFYGFDFTRPEHYDLVIDTTGMSVRDVVERILRFVGKPSGRP